MKKCFANGCSNTAHPEDELYPFCETHQSMNASYSEWQRERKRFEALLSDPLPTPTN